jgi:hypothetical protein
MDKSEKVNRILSGNISTFENLAWRCIYEEGMRASKIAIICVDLDSIESLEPDNGSIEIDTDSGIFLVKAVYLSDLKKSSNLTDLPTFMETPETDKVGVLVITEGVNYWVYIDPLPPQTNSQ